MFSKTLLLGRLGKAPELSYTQAGTARCKFSIATSEVFYDRNSNEKKEKTEWHNIIVWGKQAENCEKYLDKGSLVLVDGQNETRSWQDQQTGQKRYITEVKAFKVTFVDTGQKDRDGNRGGGNYQGGQQRRDGGGQQGGGDGNRGGGHGQGDGYDQGGGGQDQGGGTYPDDDIPF